MINLHIRMDVLLLIIGMSSCTFGAKVGIYSLCFKNVFEVEKEGEHKRVVVAQKVTGHDHCGL